MENAKLNVLYARLIYKLIDEINKVYLGSSQGTFKKQKQKKFYNHKTSFVHTKYMHCTILSKHFCDIKKQVWQSYNLEARNCKKYL